MIYKVELSPRAAKAYKKLDPSIKPHIQAAIDALEKSPLAGAPIKRLKGRLRQYHRYRAGDYRVLYFVETRERIVFVDYIQHRKDVYRGFE